MRAISEIVELREWIAEYHPEIILVEDNFDYMFIQMTIHKDTVMAITLDLEEKEKSREEQLRKLKIEANDQMFARALVMADVDSLARRLGRI